MAYDPAAAVAPAAGNGLPEVLFIGERLQRGPMGQVPLQVELIEQLVGPVKSHRCIVPVLAAVGLDGVHFHDLRHTGNQFSAKAGANLRELMERMGHDSTRPASIYLHSSAERQRAIADQVSQNARKALGKSKRSGTRTARSQSKTEHKA
jgi:hypothetical protein